ncbi:MAG: LytTR family transcriptional regulator DNA-binding domain-containing protein [Faecalibacillus faecis]
MDHSYERKSFYIYKTIKELLNEIDSKNIVQINRKNCVNINHIISENKTTIKLDNGLILKVGKMYKRI